MSLNSTSSTAHRTHRRYSRGSCEEFAVSIRKRWSVRRPAPPSPKHPSRALARASSALLKFQTCLTPSRRGQAPIPAGHENTSRSQNSLASRAGPARPRTVLRGLALDVAFSAPRVAAPFVAPARYKIAGLLLGCVLSASRRAVGLHPLSLGTVLGSSRIPLYTAARARCSGIFRLSIAGGPYTSPTAAR